MGARSIASATAALAVAALAAICSALRRCSRDVALCTGGVLGPCAWTAFLRVAVLAVYGPHYGADRRLCCQYSNVISVSTRYSMLYVSVLMPVLMVRNLANLSDSPAGTSLSALSWNHITVLVDATGGLHARRGWVVTPSACPP